MTVIVKRGKVHDGQREYRAGDAVEGLSREDEQNLVDSGAAEWPADETPEVPQSNDNGEPAADPANDLEPISVNEEEGDGGPQTELLSVEAFNDLAPADQKEYLKSLDIEPAGKENERIAQYAAWHGQAIAGGV